MVGSAPGGLLWTRRRRRCVHEVPTNFVGCFLVIISNVNPGVAIWSPVPMYGILPESDIAEGFFEICSPADGSSDSEKQQNLTLKAVEKQQSPRALFLFGASHYEKPLTDHVDLKTAFWVAHM